MDLDLALTRPDDFRQSLAREMRNNPSNLGSLFSSSPPCDSVARGDLFWQRYPAAGQCRDGSTNACGEVCRLAFDESGGWVLLTSGLLPAPALRCDSLIFRHYWPCLAGKVTVKDILGPLAASACAKPDSMVRCEHEGPRGLLSCEPATR